MILAIWSVKDKATPQYCVFSVQYTIVLGDTNIVGTWT